VKVPPVKQGFDEIPEADQVQRELRTSPETRLAMASNQMF